ncbi:MAG: hypothetical protein R2873_18415 [Caldilineaceae bacterium]
MDESAACLGELAGLQNDLYVVDLAATEATRLELGSGLVYRMALSDKLAVLVRLHPDGDTAHFIDADLVAHLPHRNRRRCIAAHGGAPESGIEPWMPPVSASRRSAPTAAGPSSPAAVTAPSSSSTLKRRPSWA